MMDQFCLLRYFDWVDRHDPMTSDHSILLF